MNAAVVGLPTPTIDFRPVNFRPGPAAELLLPRIEDIELPRRFRQGLRKVFEHVLMASGVSSYLSAAHRNEVFGAVAFAAPGTDYFALWTTAAATDMDAYVGNTAGEVASSGAYDRVAKTNNTTNFATISGDTAKVNTTAVTWAAATANWNASAVIPQLAVFDGNLKTAADNLLVWADFTVAKAILLGDTAQINASAFSYTLE